MLKKCIVCISIVLLFSATSLADIYEWVDDNGVVNFSDDIRAVPPQYKKKVKVYKQKAASPSQKKPIEPSAPKKEGLVGEESPEWWKAQFEKRQDEISRLEKVILEQKRYIDIFNRGRRVGQIYSKEEIDTYNEYTRQIPLNENKLGELKKELEGFKKKKGL